jgi:hypothetical protein
MSNEKPKFWYDADKGESLWWPVCWVLFLSTFLAICTSCAQEYEPLLEPLKTSQAPYSRIPPELRDYVDTRPCLDRMTLLDTATGTLFSCVGGVWHRFPLED